MYQTQFSHRILHLEAAANHRAHVASQSPHSLVEHFARWTPSVWPLAAPRTTCTSWPASSRFIDYLTSREGQQTWNDIQGSPSARADVNVEHVPNISTTKLLLPMNLAEYQDPALRKQFVGIWNKMTGL